LTEAFLRLVEHHGVSFVEDGGDARLNLPSPNFHLLSAHCPPLIAILSLDNRRSQFQNSNPTPPL